MAESNEQISPPLMRLVFSVMWNELRETIGTAPTATLLRRAIVLSREACPILEQISIEKDGRDYCYNIPPEVDLEPASCANIEQFVDNVLALLRALTGKVLVRQLLANPLIRQLASKE